MGGAEREQYEAGDLCCAQKCLFLFLALSSSACATKKIYSKSKIYSNLSSFIENFPIPCDSDDISNVLRRKRIVQAVMRNDAILMGAPELQWNAKCLPARSTREAGTNWQLAGFLLLVRIMQVLLNLQKLLNLKIWLGALKVLKFLQNFENP